jgi:hypothetical protein
MFRTAQRQAWLLERHARETLPLWEDRHKSEHAAPDALEIHRDVQDALSIVGRLPPRLQRIALLRALGLRHADIGEITGDSPTRVYQLVTRANDRIHEILSERHHATEPSSPRAERLWALETDPPEWLTRHIAALNDRTAANRVRRCSDGRGAGRRSRSTTTAAPRGPTASTSCSTRRSATSSSVASARSRCGRSRTSSTRAPASIAEASTTRRGRFSRRLPLARMEIPQLVPVEYAGELVALVSPQRVHIIAPWLLARPAGDPDLRFVGYMCACCGEVLAGRLPGPFTSAMAEEWTRCALIPDDAVRALHGTSDGHAAGALNVPVDQLARARCHIRAAGLRSGSATNLPGRRDR